MVAASRSMTARPTDPVRPYAAAQVRAIEAGKVLLVA
jgi:hypothetical protein